MVEKTPKILVVDDIADWRNTIRGMLRDEGYQVAVAESSKKALALLEEDVFDLAVIDIRLDETDEDDTEGITLAKVIDKQWPETQIIIITGYEADVTLTEAMRPTPGVGRLVFNYVLKKKTTEDLIPEIKKALAEVSKS